MKSDSMHVGIGIMFACVWVAILAHCTGCSDASHALVDSTPEAPERRVEAISPQGGPINKFLPLELAGWSWRTSCPGFTCAENLVSSLFGMGFREHGDVAGGSNKGNQLTPLTVNGSSGLQGRAVLDACAGATHVVVLLDNQTIVVWGGNTYGQLGTSDTTDRLVPTAVTPLPGVPLYDRIGCGQYQTWFHMAGVPTLGWQAFGLNLSGQLGCGHAGAAQVAACLVQASPVGGDYDQIVGGYDHALFTRNSGNRIYCYGDNGFGKCGPLGGTYGAAPALPGFFDSGPFFAAAGRVTTMCAGHAGSYGLSVWTAGSNMSGEQNVGHTDPPVMQNGGLVSNPYPMHFSWSPPSVLSIDGIATGGADTNTTGEYGDSMTVAYSLANGAHVAGIGNNAHAQLRAPTVDMIHAAGWVAMDGPGGAALSALPVLLSTGAKGFTTYYATQGTGTVYSVGYNLYGELGTGTATGDVASWQTSGW